MDGEMHKTACRAVAQGKVRGRGVCWPPAANLESGVAGCVGREQQQSGATS